MQFRLLNSLDVINFCVMKLSIDMDQRYAKMRAHTATHLLHAELAKIFPNTKQAGSLVDEDLLRFDFYANNLLTSQQIRDIENNINQTIFKAFPVDLIETSFEE
jgi:alanyl-tRNA synthetase